MAFAYIDKTDKKILHVIADEKTALRDAGTKLVEVDFPHRGGYPLVNYKGEDVELVIYTEPLKERFGVPIPQHIANLVDQLTG